MSVLSQEVEFKLAEYLQQEFGAVEIGVHHEKIDIASLELTYAYLRPSAKEWKYVRIGQTYLNGHVYVQTFDKLSMEWEDYKGKPFKGQLFTKPLEVQG